MTDESSQAQSERRRGGRISTARLLMYLGIFLLVLLVCLRLVPEIMLRQQLAALEAKGYPTTLEGFNHIHPPLTGPNRVDLYRQAFDLMVRPEDVLFDSIPNPYLRILQHEEDMDAASALYRVWPDGPDGKPQRREDFPDLSADVVLGGSRVDRFTEFLPEHHFLPFSRDGFEFDPPGLGRPWTETTIDRVRRVVAANKEAIDLALAARSIPEADWEVDWSDWDYDVGHLGQCRSLASELQRYVHLALIDQETEAALSGMEAIKALSNSLARDFAVISRMVEWSIYMMIFELAESMINSVDLDETTHRRLVDLVQVPDWPVGFARTAAFETVWYLQIFGIEGELVSRSVWEQRLLRLAGVQSLQKAESVRLMLPLIEVAGQMPGHMHEVPSSLFDDPTGFEWFYQDVQVPRYYQTTFRTGFRLDGQARAALAALAIDRFWLAEGRLPARLEELVPDYLDTVPLNPFSGLPMKLVHFDGGCLVYFVDDQATDEGGFEIRDDGVVQKKQRHWGTLVFRR